MVIVQFTIMIVVVQLSEILTGNFGGLKHMDTLIFTDLLVMKVKNVLVNGINDTNLTFKQFFDITKCIYCTLTDTEPTYTTSNNIQYYCDTITIMKCSI